MPTTANSQRVEKWLVRHAKELGLSSVPKGLKALARKQPTYMLNYVAWRDSVIMTNGALNKKYKLLIALGVVTLTLSEAGMSTYARLAMRAGATREEVMEAMFVAAVFSGGPGLVALGNVVDTLDK